MPAPAVSVVMPVLNPHPVFFLRAVDSILAQTMPDFELIIIEAPGDRSVATLLQERPDPRIRHVLMTPPTTLVEQRNRGLAEARCELVALMDADDESLPDRLARQVEYLTSHPDITVLGSNLEIIDHEDRPHGCREYPQDHDAIVRTMPLYNPIAQPSVMLRKTPVVAAGGYQFHRNNCNEDYDLWSRLALSGARFANLGQPVLKYRIHPVSTKSTKVRDLLRATVEVKRTHWLGKMSWPARMRYLGERALLLAPPRLVLRLFERIYYGRSQVRKRESELEASV